MISLSKSLKIENREGNAENIEKDSLLYIMSLAYKEGLSDGFKIATWLYE